MVTREEIDALKDNWAKDPIWDIENTEGFEEHREELLKFSNEMKATWAHEREAKKSKPFEAHVEDLRSEIAAADRRIGWMEDQGIPGAMIETLVMQRTQAQATLLLAEQVKRIADTLYEISDRGGLEESVRIWGS